MQDPEFLYRQAADRLRELHAKAERRNMVREAEIKPAGLRKTKLPSIRRLVNRLRGRTAV